MSSTALEADAADAAASLLAWAETNLAGSMRLAFEQLEVARQWALLHVVEGDDASRHPFVARPLGATGLVVEEYAAAELAVALEIHPMAAHQLMADAVDLHSRMASAWSAMRRAGSSRRVCRRIASLTRDLSGERAAWVDAQIAEVVGTLPPGRLLSVVEARVTEADQELADRKAVEAAARRGVWVSRENDHGTRGLFARGSAADIARFGGTVDHLAHLMRLSCPDLEAETGDQLRARALGLLANPLAALKLLIGAGEHEGPDTVAEAIRHAGPDRCRPRTTLYLHLTPAALGGQGVTRAEGLGALTRRQVVDLLGHEDITLRPVIDLNTEIAADCYEVPAAISEQLHLARPADCFPYAESLNRHLDQDHTVPYDPNGPPQQTRLSNLGLLVRHHHRIKTHAPGWTVTEHHGRFTWVTPHGRVVVTDTRGTLRGDPGP